MQNLEVSAHVGSDSRVVEKTLNAADSADGNILIPQFPVGEVHNVLVRDGINYSLDLARVHAAASSDDLAADVLRDGRGAVEGQEYRSLELGLGTLDLRLGDAQ
jgi:hypothetical protein